MYDWHVIQSSHPASLHERLEGRCLLAAGFQIELQFYGYLDDPEYQAYQAYFYTAAARWTSILTEDIPDVGEGAWGDGVDDVRIDASAAAIDGPGGILGSAQYQYRRTTGARLPINGLMRFDIADLNNATITDVITHEMGHVLGIGSLWSSSGLVNDYGGANPAFVGPYALAEYRNAMANQSLTSIPVENSGSLGTRDVHWRESVFGRELMTGYYNTGQFNPLSRISAASLIDLGYPGVNPDATDAYAPSSGNPAPAIIGLSASPGLSPPGSTFTLTANGVTDVFGGVGNVRFYRETNGIPGLQASGTVTTKDELISTDVSGSDWSAQVATGSLAPGSYTYYAQATDVHGAVSVYRSTSHTISAPPAAPSAPDLSASSDTGANSSDNVTSDNTPTLSGTSTESAGTTIRIFADGVEIGQTTVAADNTWTFTPVSGLSDGTRTLTAKAETSGGLSGPSAALTITIDTVAPQLASSSFVYDGLLGVRFEFNEDVNQSVDSSDVTFTHSTTAQTLPAVYVSSVGNSASFRFAAFPPPKGDYVATLTGAGVTDLAGNALASNPVVNFFYIPGDINQSRSVTFDDLLIIAQHYGQPGSFVQGDINYSGAIDFDDLLLMAQNYGQSLLVTRVTSTSASTRTATSSKTRSNSGLLA